MTRFRKRAGDGEGPRILFTVLIALALEIVPLPAWAEPGRPGWLALLVIYWPLALPRKFGIFSAFFSGLALDTLKGTLLGQHALALTFIAYVCLKFHLRIRVFPIWQQAMTVFMLMAIYQFLLFWIDGLTAPGEIQPGRWLPVLTSTLLWPLIAQGLGFIRRGHARG